jgi:hypothetical protein|tara:strand:- start:1991 stop:2254 length:264 start_codon:yes stop_codon:yes gene_type:complete
VTDTRINTFEVVLLVIGITAAILGFQLINQVYSMEAELSWLMVIAIFNWLMLLVLFILLSITVDVSKKQLGEIKNIVYLLEQKKGKK